MMVFEVMIKDMYQDYLVNSVCTCDILLRYKIYSVITTTVKRSEVF